MLPDFVYERMSPRLAERIRCRLAREPADSATSLELGHLLTTAEQQGASEEQITLAVLVALASPCTPSADLPSSAGAP